MRSGQRVVARVGRRPANEVREQVRKPGGRRDVGENTGGPLRALLGGEPRSDPIFPGLHWMTAGLFAAAGTEAALRVRGAGNGVAHDPLRLAPLLAAPLAGMVHVLRARSSAAPVRLATQVLDGLAAGIAVAGITAATYNALESGGMGPGGRSARRMAAALVPLTFGVTACLGLLLEREEERERREVERLRRRARVVERLVPRRRARLDRIVVHL